jgi:hypothetical protein
MTKEIGATPAQASGAAGALFGLAKTRLKPEEFTKVAGAVPGMDALLAAAPAVAGTAGSGAAGAMAKATGGASALGGLASVAPAFEKLGLKPEMAMKAVPVLTKYVTKSGGRGSRVAFGRGAEVEIGVRGWRSANVADAPGPDAD